MEVFMARVFTDYPESSDFVSETEKKSKPKKRKEIKKLKKKIKKLEKTIRKMENISMNESKHESEGRKEERNQEKKFGTKIGDAILKILPNIFQFTIKMAMTTFFGSIAKQFGKEQVA